MNIPKNVAIIIPSINPKTSVCDVVNQTAQELGKLSFVLIIQVREGKSIKEILSGHDFKLFSKQNHAYYFTPIDILPFKRFLVIKKINIICNIIALQFFLLLKKKNQVVLWNFFPHVAYLNSLFFIKKTVLFDIVDFFTSQNKKIQQKLDKQKIFLLKNADHVFAISQTLKKRYQQLHKRKIAIVPQGFDLEGFACNKKRAITVATTKEKKPRIGFIGGINDRLNYDLLNKVIPENPNIEFVFCGPITVDENISGYSYPARVDKLLSHKNVKHIQRKKRSELLAIIETFSICMIPYDIKLPFNLYCYPMKIFEYFYAGKPVLSTPILELTHNSFNGLVFTGNTKTSWQKHIDMLLYTSWPELKRAKQRQMALDNEWKGKITKILEIISLH